MYYIIYYISYYDKNLNFSFTIGKMELRERENLG